MVTSSEILLPGDSPAGSVRVERNLYTIGLVRLWSPTLQPTLTPVFARAASMHAGLSPIAVRLSLCVSFRSRIRGSQNIRVCRYWFAAATGLRRRIHRPRANRGMAFLFASGDDQPYN